MHNLKLLVFDSHPVQYRVPIWQMMEAAMPGSVHVVYASDCSVRGHADEEFGRTVSWDEPMLTGYAHTILNCEKGKPLSDWGSLTGKGVKQIIEDLKPKAILLTGLNYRYDLVAYVQAIRKGIPLWLRCETQDKAAPRSKAKSIFRALIYRIIYKRFGTIFYIGELNHQHYLMHGVPSFKLKSARYGTVDRFALMTNHQKVQLRNQTRESAGILFSDFVVGFSGKFITKKNPEILFQMLEYLPEDLRLKLCLYFIGSGPLEIALKRLSENALQKFGVRSFFAGFVNQTQLAGHYLGMDILVLPSRQMGETWGLVANEAMQAGCGVIVSDMVGSSADFSSWERFKVFKDDNALELATYVTEFAKYPRSFEWATQKLIPYSIKATADAFLNNI
ncbi:glycosyltransferase [Adhaeribacter radiodurans]|uniref:Glycosyltransferase n=1 Tax=Adhaeribacter radiodurans TaxID=2745197 RepID=A0A7L7L3N3_9BACT|nr:glycosyltransferase [Adhaeribacter radiodurans]QMU27431.1 glycosyltransferase [Adhaeribacter radiodurans]